MHRVGRKLDIIASDIGRLHAETNDKLHFAYSIRHRIEHVKEHRSEIDRNIVEVRVRVCEHDHPRLIWFVGGTIHPVSPYAYSQVIVYPCANI